MWFKVLLLIVVEVVCIEVFKVGLCMVCLLLVV